MAEQNSAGAMNVSKNAQLEQTEADSLAAAIGNAFPTELVQHSLSGEYVMELVTASDFIKTHGAPDFDLQDLQRKFATICPDYASTLTMEQGAKCIDFASKVLFQIAPESRKGDRVKNQIWRLKFIEEDSDGKSKYGVVFIATYRSTNYIDNYISGSRLCLTVKQAGMLAMKTFIEVSKLAINIEPPVFLLTPLAGSVFSRDDIPKLSAELGISNSIALAAINASCQSGGQYLAESRLHVAVLAAIVATRNVKDKRTTESIIARTIKQYLSKDKTFDDRKFNIYAKYAHGGVPAELAVDKLITSYDSVRLASLRELSRAESDSMTAIEMGPKVVFNNIEPVSKKEKMGPNDIKKQSRKTDADLTIKDGAKGGASDVDKSEEQEVTSETDVDSSHSQEDGSDNDIKGDQIGNTNELDGDDGS